MTTAARTYSEESSHWYRQDGSPCYEVERADGSGMRPTTLRDAKKLGLYPSVTTILKCIAKPELQAWIVEQAVLSVLTTPRIVGEADDAFVKRVLSTERIQDQEAQKARDRGTEIHTAMESLFRGETITAEIEPWVRPAFEAIADDELVCTEKTLATDEGFGGCLDLVQAYLGGSKWIITDFKSCKNLPTKGPWREHCLQLAAYARMWCKENGADIKTRNVYISTTQQGAFAVYDHDVWEWDYAKGFHPLLKYWQWANGMLT